MIGLAVPTDAVTERTTTDWAGIRTRLRPFYFRGPKSPQDYLPL
jgi:hypothetical protein